MCVGEAHGRFRVWSLLLDGWHSVTMQNEMATTKRACVGGEWVWACERNVVACGLYATQRPFACRRLDCVFGLLDVVILVLALPLPSPLAPPSRSRTRGSLFAPSCPFPLTGCVVVVFRPTAARRHCIAVPHSRHKRRTWPLLSRPNFPSEKAGVVVVSFLWPAAICSIACGAAIRRRSPLLALSRLTIERSAHTESLAPIEIPPRSPSSRSSTRKRKGCRPKVSWAAVRYPGHTLIHEASDTSGRARQAQKRGQVERQNSGHARGQHTHTAPSLTHQQDQSGQQRSGG